MNRAKLILVSLISGLFLVGSVKGSVNCFGNAVCGFASHQHFQDSVSTDFQPRHEAVTAPNSFEQCARRWTRRTNAQHCGDDFTIPGAIAQNKFLLTPGFAETTDSCQCSPDLAQCWQFQWRTASEPRAPSSFV